MYNGLMKTASPATILIHTDGSCLGNPGPGGWGVVIEHDEKRKELSGGENPSTNNRMEMKGMIEALKWVKENMLPSTPAKPVHSAVAKFPLRIELFSDSSLLINTLNLGWKRKANKDLWAELDELRHGLTRAGAMIRWQWVKGHNGHPLNERCDALANAAAVKAAKQKPRPVHSPEQKLF